MARVQVQSPVLDKMLAGYDFTEAMLLTCELTRSAQVYYHSFAEQRFFSLHVDIKFALGAIP